MLVKVQKPHFLKKKVEKENFDEKRSGFLGRGGVVVASRLGLKIGQNCVTSFMDGP
jgi:hypothetical protein